MGPVVQFPFCGSLFEQSFGNRWSDIQRCCQTNSNQSQFAAKGLNLPGTKLAPLGESGGSVEFEIVTAVEGAFLVEMIVD